MQQQFQLYVRHPDFDLSLRLLVDLEEMSDAITGLSEIYKLKKLYQMAYHEAQDIVDVCIVPGNRISRVVARAFALLMRDRRPMKVTICTDFQTALKTLGVSQIEFERERAECDRSEIAEYNQRARSL